MKVCLISLGCDKNLVDSEVMLGLLRDEGHLLVDDEAEAEAIVVNTCCFIHDAKEESIETILMMARLKETGKLRRLIVTGCLAERYYEEIQEQIPEVDGILGTSAYEDIVAAISAESLYAKKKPLDYLPMPDTKRASGASAYVSYLKIAEGCDKCCTYCIIPKLRGSYRSYPMERLVAEAKALAEQGTKELILVAQETTLYGVDLYGEKRLPELLRRLCEIEELQWIRLLYCYPEEIDDALIAVMKEQPKLCHYLDMPIQHGVDSILKRMGRRTTKAELMAITQKLRGEIPDIALRTTLITGFPGESSEDFEELLAFVEEMRFDRLGVFTYSKEENTPAALLKDQVPKRTKESRRNRVMRLQQAISAELAAEQIGRRLQVMVDGYLPEEGVYVCRTYMDAPAVDGTVFVRSDASIMSGELIPVRIVEANEYDLIGELVEE